MCEANEEIQKVWIPKAGDYVQLKKNRQIYLISSVEKSKDKKKVVFYTNIINGNDSWCYIEFFKDNFIWLPTLEQLFEIWSYLCNTNNKAHPNYLAGDHLPTQFFYRIHKELTRTNIGIWFDKAVCLEIIMRDFYKKVWTGEKWEKVTR